jgi:hypothetical protein
VPPTPTSSDPLPVDGTLPDGFVLYSNPAPDANNVSTSISQIQIFYNQPMKDDSGGGGAWDKSYYRLKNIDEDENIKINSVAYNPVTHIATIYFDNTDEDWLPGTLYEIRVDKNIKNLNETKQGADVLIYFTTAP